jgi:hypothetical protein
MAVELMEHPWGAHRPSRTSTSTIMDEFGLNIQDVDDLRVVRTVGSSTAASGRLGGPTAGTTDGRNVVITGC